MHTEIVVFVIGFIIYQLKIVSEFLKANKNGKLSDFLTPQTKINLTISILSMVVIWLMLPDIESALHVPDTSNMFKLFLFTAGYANTSLLNFLTTLTTNKLFKQSDLIGADEVRNNTIDARPANQIPFTNSNTPPSANI